MQDMPTKNISSYPTQHLVFQAPSTAYHRVLFLLVGLFGMGWLSASDLVEVSPITNRIIMLRFDDGHIDYGKTEAGNVVYNQTLDTVAIYRLHNFQLTSPTDRNFLAPVSPLTIGRKAKSNDVHSAYPKEGDPEFILEHFVYLELPAPLRQGETYTLRMNRLAYNTNTYTFTFDAAKLRSWAVHTSQVGYRSGGAKYAYVSQWLGDFDNGIITAGKGRFPGYDGKRFDVVRTSDGISVHTGTIRMRKNHGDGGPATDTPFDGAPTWFPCDCDYEQSFTFSDVLEADFSELTIPGEYRVLVADMGTSYPFMISADAYREPFNYVLRGIFFQRQGIVKETQDGTVYPRDYHPDDIEAARFRYDKNWRWEDSPHHNHKSADTDFATTPLPVHGWYHDAGDWDGYPHHGYIPLQLNLLYDLKPASFHDGDVGLRYKLAESDTEWVDEGNNGIPDLLDEAAWLIKFYRRAKDTGLALGLTTGGVPGGYSGVDAGALDGYPGWEDPRDLRFSAEAPFTTYMYAANAAMYAANLQTAGYASDEVADWRTEAVEAWDWAEANLREGDLNKYMTSEIRFLAAMALYKATGVVTYQTLFKAAIEIDDKYLTGEAGYDAPKYWEIAAALYANLPTDYPGLDLDFRQTVKDKVIAVAKAEYLEPHDRRGYRAAYAWNKPHFLGMQSTPMLTLLITAHKLTGDERYAAAIDNSAAYFLGGNPDHVSWVTGLSEGSVKYPFHPNSWWLNDYDDRVYSNDILPGYVPYGSYMSPDFFGPGWTWTGDEDYSKTTMYPKYEHQTWPIGEQRIENRTSIAGSEFTTWQNMAPAAFTYGYLTDTTYGGYTFNERPTVALELTATDIPADGVYLRATASADTRRVDYYFDEHFIGSASQRDGNFAFFWDPPLPAGTNDVAITAVVYDDKGLISIPSSSGRSTVNITKGSAVVITGIAITKRKKAFRRSGQSRRFRATVTPAGAANPTIFWSSSDPDVCTVSASGLVTAVGNGVCQITAVSQDGGHTATTTVKVGR